MARPGEVVLLDTRAWLWWMHDPTQLSPRARRSIERAADGPGAVVSAISVWEVAVKVEAGKLSLPLDLREWFDGARTFPGLRIEPLEPEDAIESARLPGELHRDPADRILAAIARRRAIPLVTRDRNLRGYSYIRTVW